MNYSQNRFFALSPSYIQEGARGSNSIALESQLLTERKLFLDEPITNDTATAFAKAMLYLTKTNDAIDIYISSPGGEVTAGLAIYDMMQGCKNEIRTYCIGQASSMAVILLAAGAKSKRFILPHSRVMIHEVLLNGNFNGSATSVSRVSDSIMETKRIVNDILAKHTGKTLEEINLATSFDNYMNAEEAVAFGLCDKIISMIST